MSDSDSDCGELLRMSSTSSLPTEWDAVPETQDFKFKGKKADGAKTKFLYTLKKGAQLPYSTRLSVGMYSILLVY
jgi:hypothetical protein